MRRGAYVRFRVEKPRPHALTGRGPEPVEHIPGRWMAFNGAAGGSWWLLPADGEARTWADTHKDKIISGCVRAYGRELEADYR